MKCVYVVYKNQLESIQDYVNAAKPKAKRFQFGPVQGGDVGPLVVALAGRLDVLSVTVEE